MHYKELIEGINLDRKRNNLPHVLKLDSFPVEPYDLDLNKYVRTRINTQKTKKTEDIQDFLKVWNPRVPFDSEKLRRTIEETEHISKTLRKTSLQRIDFKKESNGINFLYERFDKVLKHTGSSKALHVLVPQVFVMWDTKIRDYWGFSVNANAYLGFLMRMQWELKEVIQTYMEDFGCDDEDAFLQICRKMYKEEEPITVLLDQHNYAITRSKEPNLKNS